MQFKSNVLFISSIFFVVTIRSVDSINCYQCSGTDSENPFECNEFLDSDTDIVAIDCATIHDAQYCIKHVGRYEGVAIECYQCNSSDTLECGDGLINLDGGFLKATPCDHVYNAQYCIKQSDFTRKWTQRVDLCCYMSHSYTYKGICLCLVDNDCGKKFHVMKCKAKTGHTIVEVKWKVKTNVTKVG